LSRHCQGTVQALRKKNGDWNFSPKGRRPACNQKNGIFICRKGTPDNRYFVVDLFVNNQTEFFRERN